MKKRRQKEPAGTIPYEKPEERARSAGQSGDTQGLPDTAEADSQSVAELVEEGQFFEAEVISGVENAPDPDEDRVRTREKPVDDVAPEYRDRDLEKDVERG